MLTDRAHLAMSRAEEPLILLLHGEQDEHVSRRVRDTGVWEPFESTLILEALNEGGCFVDVGANIGYFSVLAAQKVGPSGRVIAFEPDPANHTLLRRSAELNQLPQLTAVQAGLSDTAETMSLHLSENNFGDHQLFPDAVQAGDRRTINVELLNGSDCLTALAARADFIKVDVQGAEFQVMQGLLAWLKSLPYLPKILIELTPYSLRHAGHSGRELIELLASLHMQFCIVDHVEQVLAASSVEELALWCDNVDSCALDEGFMNIMLIP